MAIFQSDAKALLKRLADKTYDSSQERDELLAQLAATEGLKARDVAWMLFRPDRAYREAVVGLLKQIGDPETADVVITISTDAKQSAMRNVAIFPCIMAVCYLGLIIHFKRKGGYTAVELSAGGKLSTEYAPTPEQEVDHAEATPRE